MTTLIWFKRCESLRDLHYGHKHRLIFSLSPWLQSVARRVIPCWAKNFRLWRLYSNKSLKTRADLKLVRIIYHKIITIFQNDNLEIRIIFWVLFFVVAQRDKPGGIPFDGALTSIFFGDLQIISNPVKTDINQLRVEFWFDCHNNAIFFSSFKYI